MSDDSDLRRDPLQKRGIGDETMPRRSRRQSDRTSIHRRQATDEARKQRAERARAQQAQLMVLLANPVYRARYEAVRSALERAQMATERALAEIGKDLAAAEAKLGEIEDGAARLPDGTSVFRDANGVIRDADGNAIPEELAATILWRGNEPGFEAYRSQKNRVARHREALEQVWAYQVSVLGHASDRLTDEDNPPSLEELDDILDAIEAMPDHVRHKFSGEANPTSVKADPSAVTLPDLGAKP